MGLSLTGAISASTRHDPRRDGQGLAAIAGEAQVAGAIAGSSITKTHQIACPFSDNCSECSGFNKPLLMVDPDTRNTCAFFTENAEVNPIPFNQQLALAV